MAEMGRFGEEQWSADIFVPARYVLHKGVFEVGYVPILGFAIFSRFGWHFKISAISRWISPFLADSRRFSLFLGISPNLGVSRAPVFDKFAGSSVILAVRNRQKNDQRSKHNLHSKMLILYPARIVFAGWAISQLS